MTDSIEIPACPFPAKEKEVKEAMKEDEVQLYLLAEDSGGRAFFPTDAKETPAIATQIAKDLRAQYVISYYPSNESHGGSFRTVRVALSHGDDRKLVVRTRQGYYARDDRGMTQGAGRRRL